VELCILRGRVNKVAPVILKVRKGGTREIHGTTENVSRTGVLSTDSEIPLEARVGLTMAFVQSSTPRCKLRMSNPERVVRVEPDRKVSIELT